MDRTRRAFALATVFLTTVGCGAVFPELGTPIRDVPPGYRLEPDPPSDLLYIAFVRAVIPDKTRDGRAWSGTLPDAFAKLIVNDVERIVTPVHAKTLNPTWPNQKRGNYRIEPGAEVRVELWARHPINNHPICSERLRGFHEQASSERLLDVSCASGALIQLAVEPAHAKIGLGLYYEIRTNQVFVSRVLAESPASRAGVARGDEIVRIMNESARGMPEGRVRSLMNSNGSTGLSLVLSARDGTERTILIQNGPIYPTLEEGIL